MIEKLYTVEEVAELASVTGRTIRNYLKSGRLVGRKIGGQWRFPESEVQRLLTGGEAPPAGPEVLAGADAAPETATGHAQQAAQPAQTGAAEPLRDEPAVVVQPLHNQALETAATQAAVYEPTVPAAGQPAVGTQAQTVQAPPYEAAVQPAQTTPYETAAQTAAAVYEPPAPRPYPGYVAPAPLPTQAAPPSPSVGYAPVYPQAYAGPVYAQPVYPEYAAPVAGPISAPVYEPTAAKAAEPTAGATASTAAPAAEQPASAAAQPEPAQNPPLSVLSDVGMKVMQYTAQVHDCSMGPQVCAVVELNQTIETARRSTEALEEIAKTESEGGSLCECYVEYDERYFVARYTLFGSSSFLAKCLKIIG